MKKICFLLLTFLSLALTEPVFSQSMSNTDAVLTLNNTCINGGMSSGTYNLLMHYTSDAGSSTVNLTGVAVSLVNGIMTITVPAGTFPTVASTGYWSMPDTYNGDITLSNGSFATLMYWALDNNYIDQFNCVPLPIWFSSFTGTLSGTTVVLNWTTGTEQNLSAIEVWRSSTGSNYYKIGQKTPTGGGSSYSFTDNNPDASNFYYVKMASSVGAQGIYSPIVHVSCAACHYTPPTPVNCAYTISGTDHICNLESPAAYSLSSAVPNYSTIVWSVDNTSAASLHTYPTWDPTKVTVLKKNAAAGVYLKATLSACSNVISKFIVMGTPAPTITTTLACPQLYGYAGNSPGATNYQWHVVDLTTYTETITNTTSASWNAYIGNGHSWNIGFQYTNVCGNSVPAVSYGFVCTAGPGGGGHKIKVSPNPSSGIVTIGLTPAPDPTSPDQAIKSNSGGIDPIYLAPVDNKTAATGDVHALTRTTPNTLTLPGEKPKIYEVKVVDAQGVVRKTFQYPGGIENVSVNLSGLISGIYTVQVYDNKTWTSSQVVLAK